MHGKTSGMDQELQAQIDEILAEITGSAEQPQSFTSEKNGAVERVQFVIATDAIQKAQAEEPEPEVQETTFFERIGNLFR